MLTVFSFRYMTTEIMSSEWRGPELTRREGALNCSVSRCCYGSIIYPASVESPAELGYSVSFNQVGNAAHILRGG